MALTIIKSILPKKKISLKITDFYALAAFVFPLIIYSLTAARTITSYADSAELTNAAFNLDAAHPPGYPLYILLGKLFTLIPLGSIAFRVNLLSSVLGALTIFFVYKIFKIAGFKAKTSFLASQVIAFSYSFWLYSLTAEIYSLNNLFAIIIIYLSLLWAKVKSLRPKRPGLLSIDRLPAPDRMVLGKLRTESPKKTTIHPRANSTGLSGTGAKKLLYLTSFIFALALSHHTSIIMLVPGILYLILIVDKKFFRNIHLPKTIPFLLLGLTPFILIPFLSQKPHYPLFGNIPNVNRLAAYLTRADYGGFLSAGPEFSPDITGILDLSIYYFKLLFTRFTPLAPILAFFFVILSFLRKHTLFTYLSITLLTTAVFFPLFALRGASAADFHSQGVIERFALLGLLILGIVFLFSLRWLLSEFKPKKSQSIFQTITLFLAFFLLVSNYSKVNKKDYNLAHNYALNILNQVEDNSIIFTSDDMTIFSLLYFVNSEKLKPNITLINTGFLEVKAYQQELLVYWPDLYLTGSVYPYDIARDIITSNQDKRPVYFVMLKDPYPFGFDGNPYYLNPMGLVLKADTKADKETIEKGSLINYWQNYNLTGLKNNYHDPFAKLAKNNYSFRAQVNARVYQNIGCLLCSQQEISTIATYIDDNENLQQILSSLTPLEPQTPNQTVKDFLQSAQNNLDQDTGTDLFFLHRAIWDLQQALAIDPDNNQAQTLLTQLFLSIGLSP